MPSPPRIDEVILNGELSHAQVAAIAAGARIGLDPGALDRVRDNRETLERILSSGTPVYGISTGFGALVSNMVAPELQRHLQVNLLRSHAAGTGEDLPAGRRARGDGSPAQRPAARSLRRAAAGARAGRRAAQRRLRPARAAHRLAGGQRRSGAQRPRVPAAAGGGGGVRARRHAGERCAGAGTARAGPAGAREQGGPGADQRHPFHERDRRARGRTGAGAARCRRRGDGGDDRRSARRAAGV